MSQIKQLVREINKSKNLESNIPAYKEILFDLYNQCALLHTTMDYFVLYETLQEKQGKEDGYLKDTLEVVHEIVKEVFCGDVAEEEKKQEVMKKILLVRDDVIKKMKVLTMYTDRLQIYEHVVNRLELKYGESIELADVDTFVQKVQQYIFSGKDNVVINESIKEILAELPVRMARSKYFQLIENSMSVYKDSDKSALNRYVYMLETSAMLYEPEGVGEYFPEAKAFCEQLEQVEFSNLSEEEFWNIYHKLEDMAAVISQIADLYVGIQGLINSLYCYVTSLEDNRMLDETDQVCIEIVQNLQTLFENGKWEEIPDTISDKLVLTEGKQEKIVEDMMQLETVLMELQIGHNDKIEELGLGEAFDRLDAMQQLLSSSGTFVEFDEEMEEEPADEAYIVEQTQALLEKLKVQFAKNEMCVNRAVIAATISKFPVFFTSSKEVEEYILQSLNGCKDDAERQASMNVIQAIMEMSGYEAE